MGFLSFRERPNLVIYTPCYNLYCSQPKKIATKGATLLSVRAPVGPTNLARHECCIGRGLAAVHPSGSIEPKFVLYLFRSIKPELTTSGTGTTFKAISKGFVESLRFNLPPLPEQRRIVEKIEELLAELDQGIESLKTARAQLATYRQAVLKHAFEGKLTAQWREENKDKLETLGRLLASIKREREIRYAQQLEEWKAAVKAWEEKGKSARKPRKPKKPPRVTDVTYTAGEALPPLPDGWLWIAAGALLQEPPANGHSVKDRVSGFPVLRLTAITGETLDLSERKSGDWEREEALSYLVCEGEFLLARGSGSKSRVGRGGLVPKGKHDVAYPDTMVRLRFSPQVVDGAFFSYVWNSRLLRRQIEDATRTTAGIYKINQGHILSFLVPLCWSSEQEVVVDRLSAKSSIIDAAETRINDQLLKAGFLRRSVLKKAFSGQLVPQYPNDEPASALLDRIRAERERSTEKTPPNRMSGRRVTA